MAFPQSGSASNFSDDHAACFNDAISLKLLQTNPSARIIDARPAEKYSDAHIEGAINIPVSLIPTRRFLDSDPLILIGGDAEIEKLIEMCTALRRNRGQLVWVEKSGIHASWAKRMLVGSRVAQSATLTDLSAKEFLDAQRAFKWQLVFIVDDNLPADLQQYGGVVSPDRIDAMLSKQISSVDPQNERILLVDGRDTPSQSFGAGALDFSSVRYFTGGLAAYQQMLNLHSAYNQRQVASTGGPKSCAEQEGSAG
jgi:rhodanese-related sulfurtransferase